MTNTISIIYGSTRDGRQGIKAAKFIANKLKERGHIVHLIDPLEYEFPLLRRKYMYYEKGTAPKAVEAVAKFFSESDGFIVVSGEYNHSVPAALKNILDHYGDEYKYKPSGIVTYSGGPFGGVRAAVHLRAIMGELGTVSIPTMFPISAVQSTFDDNGNALDKVYDERINGFLDQFEWYLGALKEARKKGTPKY